MEKAKEILRGKMIQVQKDYKKDKRKEISNEEAYEFLNSSNKVNTRWWSS